MYILTQNSNSIASPKNAITDGQIVCTYEEIVSSFKGFDKFFLERGINIKDSLVLECENSVPTAIVLLYLLSKGYSFLLLPKEAKTSDQQASKPAIPNFCRYRITAESLTEDGEIVDLTQPDRFLYLVENEQWIDKSQDRDRANQKLYLRTSGSTGTPKMAAHSHANLIQNALNCGQRLGLQSEDRVAIPVPLYHMYGLGAAFLPSVLAGASIDLQKGANLLRYLQRENEFNPNVGFMTPIFCETLVKGRKSPRKYRFTVAAGDRVREQTFAKYESQFGCLVKLYGSTEMGAIAAASPNDDSEVRASSVGLPMSGVQIRLQKNQMESTDEIKNEGELWCHHEYGFDGYVDTDGKPINQNENNDRWFYMKDLGRLGTDGRIEVLGRSDRSINRDGLLVFFSDVEKAIETISGIDSVVVVSQGESQRGKGLVAYCVLAKNTNISESDLRTSCFEILPKRAIPDRISILNSFPLLPNGKVDLQNLTRMANNAEETNLIRR